MLPHESQQLRRNAPTLAAKQPGSRRQVLEVVEEFATMRYRRNGFSNIAAHETSQIDLFANRQRKMGALPCTQNA